MSRDLAATRALGVLRITKPRTGCTEPAFASQGHRTQSALPRATETASACNANPEVPMIRHSLLVCTACVALLCAAPVSAATYPDVELPRIPGASVPTVHPFLLADRASVEALIADAKISPGTAVALKRLAASVKSWVNNPAFIAQKTTPYSGTDLGQYMAQFSVFGGHGSGAALIALSLAFYHQIHLLDPSFGDAATDAAAANGARAIIWSWASAGFRPGGKLISSYQTFTGVDANGTPTRPDAIYASVNLQIGRGMFPLVLAQDIMQSTTPAEHNVTINAFLASMRDMLIQAANRHYANSNTFDCHRYDNQADAGMTGLLALGWYTGDMDLVNDLAGVPTAPKLLSWTWPQQVEAQIYGTGEGARSCNPQTSVGDKYNPVAARGEITDRERNEPHQSIGYPTGSLESLMQAARMFRKLGFDAYHFTGPHGQGIQAALDYYAQYYTAYASVGPATIPATGTIPDIAQYAGDAYTTAAAGAAVTGGDGLIWPYRIASTVYPEDAGIKAALDRAQALYNQERTATNGRTSYLPASTPDIMSLMMLGSRAN
ncbi:MAG: hypothetical protein ACRYG8_41770 [Janthinobacterium lividum]